jgi:serpin B
MEFLSSRHLRSQTSNTLDSFKNLTFIVAVWLCQSVPAVAQPNVVENNNAFALKFFMQWQKQTDKNIVVSPFSISSALSLAYPGARNATATQMKTAVHFLKSPDQQSRQLNSVYTNITAPGSPMVIANTIWMQKGFKIQQGFLDVNAKYGDAAFRQVNFAGAADATRMEINASIEKQTRNKIIELLPRGSINSQSRLVLTNAIYFKDTWAIAFDPKETKDQDFFLSTANPVKAKFMSLQHVTFNFFENDVVTIVELPYKSDRFSMLIFLPKGDVATFEKSFTADAYKSWNLNQGRFRSVQLPRFKIDHEVQPADLLRQFGMTDAFQEGKADFSGISKEVRLFISGIFHKAFIEVNEEGTEAAAATAVVVQAESAERPQKEMDFIANRPFLFILRDRITNSILFIGKVKDPTQ